MLEYEKYQELQLKLHKVQQEYEQQLHSVEESKTRALEEMMQSYEAKLEEKMMLVTQVKWTSYQCLANKNSVIYSVSCSKPVLLLWNTKGDAESFHISYHYISTPAMTKKTFEILGVMTE